MVIFDNWESVIGIRRVAPKWQQAWLRFVLKNIGDKGDMDPMVLLMIANNAKNTYAERFRLLELVIGPDLGMTWVLKSDIREKLNEYLETTYFTDSYESL